MSSLLATSWEEEDIVVIMGRTRYICYHGENKIHLFSWGEQDTFVIMGRNKKNISKIKKKGVQR
jgi:hypothetical protein